METTIMENQMEKKMENEMETLGPFKGVYKDITSTTRSLIDSAEVSQPKTWCSSA